MAWVVLLPPGFEAEFAALDEDVQDDLLAKTGWLEIDGPKLGRPHVDTLHGSRHANMKELRFRSASGVWRVAFAFDPDRQAVLLVAGDKAGANQRRFYDRLIAVADERFAAHLNAMADKPGKGRQ